MLLVRWRRKLRSLIRQLWIHALDWTGGLQWAERQLARRDAIIVLTFHRVLDAPEYVHTDSPEGMLVKKATFQKLSEYVARNYEPTRVVEGRSRAVSRNVPRIAFTFDDGWTDNFTTAAPIAAECGIPLTIFICPALVGYQSPFWPEQVGLLWRFAQDCGKTARLTEVTRDIRLQFGDKSSGVEQSTESFIAFMKKFPAEARAEMITRVRQEIGCTEADTAIIDRTMNWEEIHQLDSCHVDFGSHTLSHEILTHLSNSTLEFELVESKDIIAQETRKPCELFAYPNGTWSHETKAFVANAGYRLAFTNQTGAWTSETDPLLVPRVNVCEGSLIGIKPEFSVAAFKYLTFWKPFLANRKRLFFAGSEISENPHPRTGIKSLRARSVE